MRGELWRASQRKEEEEEGRSGGRLVSKKPVLSRLDGLMKFPTMNQIRRIRVMANPNKPPRRIEAMNNRKQEAPKIAAPIQPKDDSSVAKIRFGNLRNCLQAGASRGTSSTIRCFGFSFSM